MCSGFNMITGQTVNNCAQCEEGTVETPFTGMSAGGSIKATCEIPNGIEVEFCPASDPQRCKYVVCTRHDFRLVTDGKLSNHQFQITRDSVGVSPSYNRST